MLQSYNLHVNSDYKNLQSIFNRRRANGGTDHHGDAESTEHGEQ